MRPTEERPNEVSVGRQTSDLVAPSFLDDVVRAKGLAIFLVVLGHLVTGRPPADNDWYLNLRTVIYTFHMPFFIYLSGFVFYHTNGLEKFNQEKFEFILKRAKRLLVPFGFFGLFVAIGKNLAASFIYVDKKPESIFLGFWHLIIDTSQSSALFVWYLFVIFEITLVVCCLSLVIRSSKVMFVIAVFLAPFYTLTTNFYLDRFFIYFPFFLIGGIAATAPRYFHYVDRYLWLWMIAFVAAIVVTRILHTYFLSLYLCGVLSIPFLHGIVRTPLVTRIGVLARLGTFAFSIYLLNTSFIGLTKGAFLVLMPWDGPNFLLFALAMLTAGILGPILVKQHIFRRWRVTDNMTD